MNLNFKTLLILIIFIVTPQTLGAFLFPNKEKYEEGLTYYNSGQFNEAIKSFEEALANDPDNSEILNALANSYHKKAEFENAEKLYNQALSKVLSKISSNNNQRARLNYNLGNNYFRMEQFDQAIKSYQNALDYDDQDTASKKNLEIALKKLQEQSQNQKNQQDQNNESDSNKSDNEKSEDEKQGQNKNDNSKDQNSDNNEKPKKKKPSENKEPDSDSNQKPTETLSLKRAEEILKAFSEKETKHKGFRFYKQEKSERKNRKNW